MNKKTGRGPVLVTGNWLLVFPPGGGGHLYERRDGLIKNRHIIADFLKLKYFDNFIKIYVISC